jgi:hypothetical protein
MSDYSGKLPLLSNTPKKPQGPDTSQSLIEIHSMLLAGIRKKQLFLEGYGQRKNLSAIILSPAETARRETF